MRRVVGGVAVFVGALLLSALGTWTVFVAWVWTQDMGGDREAIRFIQPATCLCMMPPGFLVLAGAILGVMPAPQRQDSFD